MQLRRSLMCLIAGLIFIQSVFPLQAAASNSAALGRVLGQPKTDGRWVVWWAYENADDRAPLAIYALSLPDGQHSTIRTGLPHDPPKPLPTSDVADLDIDAGTAVWVEGTGNSRAIQAMTLASGRIQTVATGAVTLPAIRTNMVTWWENVDEERARQPGGALPATLKGRDISTMAPAVTLAQTPNNAYGFGPSIMGDGWVAWKQVSALGLSFEWQIMAVQLSGGTPREVGSGWGADFDLQGTQLTYYDDGSGGRPQSSLHPKVHTVDLATGARTTSEPGSEGGAPLTTDGRYVFWNKARSNGDQGFSELWGYDPRTDSAFLVASQPSGHSDLIYTRPHARSDTLVWLHLMADGTGTLHIERIADILPSARRAAPPLPVPGQQYFDESGHTLRGTFADYWSTNGGLAVFGFPLTEEFVQKNPDAEQGLTVQYLERQRFELHPENAGTPYLVLLGRLGAEALERRGVNWQSLPKVDPAVPHYYAETGHAVAPQFWDYWRNHGLELGDRGLSEREALALTGYPLTEPRIETNSSGDAVLTQWFERARLEYHPSNPPAYRVLLGRLAADRLVDHGW